MIVALPSRVRLILDISIDSTEKVNARFTEMIILLKLVKIQLLKMFGDSGWSEKRI